MSKNLKGILGEKLGMTQVFDANNRVVPVTVVKAGPNVVTRIRTPEVDGYSAVQLAYGEISPRKINKPLRASPLSCHTDSEAPGLHGNKNAPHGSGAGAFLSTSYSTRTVTDYQSKIRTCRLCRTTQGRFCEGGADCLLVVFEVTRICPSVILLR